MQVRTQSWAYVVSYYAGLSRQPGWHIEPLLELVSFLAGSPYAQALFPYTSHDVLGIGRVANFTAQNAELRIQFNAASQSFKFTYYQRPDERSPWVRRCPAPECHQVLLRIFHKRLRWFAPADAA